jgi:hypothetical protein
MPLDPNDGPAQSRQPTSSPPLRQTRPPPSHRKAGTPMGPNCSSDITDLLLHTLEYNFLLSLCQGDQIALARTFGDTFRYQHDLIPSTSIPMRNAAPYCTVHVPSSSPPPLSLALLPNDSYVLCPPDPLKSVAPSPISSSNGMTSTATQPSSRACSN